MIAEFTSKMKDLVGFDSSRSFLGDGIERSRESLLIDHIESTLMCRVGRHAEASRGQHNSFRSVPGIC